MSKDSQKNRTSIEARVAGADAPVVPDVLERRVESGGDYRPRAASYARYSSDNQSDSSVADQQRICRDRAASMNMLIRPELEFSDHAISGTKLARPGLQRMLKLAQTGEFVCIFFYSLSRLGRESAITVPMLKKLVHEYGIRVVSISEGIDSEQANWEMFSSISNVIHEHYIRQLSSDVFRGLEGTLEGDYSVGDFRFGYKTIPSPDGRVTGRGRNAKPKMVYQIHDEQAVWVRQVFSWFVDEKRKLTWIAQELNHFKVDTDHRSRTGEWRDGPVRTLLRSPKYVGVWPWGLNQNCRRPSDGAITQKRRPVAETQRWQRNFPELRLIADEQWYAAQCLLDENQRRVADRRKKKDGRLGGSSGRGSPSHMLAGLIQCGECGTIFNTCGSGAKYMGCPRYKKGLCSCRTTLPRSLSERLILEAVIQQLKSNQEWLDKSFEFTVAAVCRHSEAAPTNTAQLERSLKSVRQKIQNLLNRMEDGDNDPNLAARLQERTKEQAELEQLLRTTESRQTQLPASPDRTWFDGQLARISDLLMNATPAAYLALQKLIDAPIQVHEVEVPDRKRRYFRAVFKMRTSSVCRHLNLNSEREGNESPIASSPGEEIIIDFRECSDHPERAALQARVWELHEQGLLRKEIAKQLAISKSHATVILQEAAAARGIELVDGRKYPRKRNE